jgi:hypothetical protein
MPVSYDIIRIGSILKDITRYFKDLESLKIQDVCDLSDSRNFYAASMILFAPKEGCRRRKGRAGGSA